MSRCTPRILRPFKAKDSWLYFGRGRETEVLLNFIYSLPIVLLFAPSGTGKSSLIRAGVIPRLRADPLTAILQVSKWHPGVVAQLRESVHRLIDPKSNITPESIGPQLEAFWSRTRRKPILILDQFEDVLRDRDNLDALWKEIALIVNRPECHARVVVSIREDYLAGLDPLMSRVPGLMENRFRLGPLSREAIEEAFVGPLARMNPPFQAEPKLVPAVIADLERSGRDLAPETYIEPGYFQVICRRLWELDYSRPDRTLTLETYEKTGRSAGIVEAFIQDTIQKALLPDEQQILYAMLRYLVLPSGAKIPLSVDDIAGLVRLDDFTEYERSEAGLPSEQSRDEQLPLQTDKLRPVAQAVLDKLCHSEALILRRVSRGVRVEFELTHDLLAPILLQWRESFSSYSDFLLKTRFDEQLRERALSESQVAEPASWRLEFLAIRANAESEKEDRRLSAAGSLGRLLLRRLYRDPETHDSAQANMFQLANDPVPAVRKEAIRALSEWPFDQSPRPSRGNFAFPVIFDRRFAMANAFYIFVSIGTSLAIAVILDWLGRHFQ